MLNYWPATHITSQLISHANDNLTCLNSTEFVFDCATPQIIKKIVVNRRCYAHVWHFHTMRELEKGGAVQNEYKDRARVKFRHLKLQPIVLSCQRSLKGKQTYNSSMNLTISRQQAGENTN